MQPLLGHKNLNVPVHRSDSQLRVMALRASQNLLWREWPIGFKKRLADGGLLFCVSLFHCYQERILA